MGFIVDSGKEIAYVIPPSYVLNNSTLVTMPSARWGINGDAFDLSFNMDKVTDKYGSGVYTITLIGSSDKGELIPATNKSIFVRDLP